MFRQNVQGVLQHMQDGICRHPSLAHLPGIRTKMFGISKCMVQCLS